MRGCHQHDRFSGRDVPEQLVPVGAGRCRQQRSTCFAEAFHERQAPPRCAGDAQQQPEIGAECAITADILRQPKAEPSLCSDGLPRVPRAIRCVFAAVAGVA